MDEGILSLSTGAATRARALTLAWLAGGAAGLQHALDALPRERWVPAAEPQPNAWTAARHARHLALRETWSTLPAVRAALGGAERRDRAPALELQRLEAAW